jgi:putative phosphoribosyl transferase
MFRDRRDAGRQLAELLVPLGLTDPVVLALPRGGVPVGAEVARRLGAPLEVFVARKLGAPGRPELGIGALAEAGLRGPNAEAGLRGPNAEAGLRGPNAEAGLRGPNAEAGLRGPNAEIGAQVVDREGMRHLGISDAQLDALVIAEQAELARRVQAYRGDRALPELAGRDVVLVDDGLATGVTAQAAVAALRRHRPRRLVLAVPVAAPDRVDALQAEGLEVVCVARPRGFQAVGTWYDRFDQTSDAEVLDLLRAGAGRRGL